MNDYECAWCGKPGTLTRGQKQRIKKMNSEPCCSLYCVGRYGHFKSKGWKEDMILEQLEIVRGTYR